MLGLGADSKLETSFSSRSKQASLVLSCMLESVCCLFDERVPRDEGGGEWDRIWDTSEPWRVWCFWLRTWAGTLSPDDYSGWSFFGRGRKRRLSGVLTCTLPCPIPSAGLGRLSFSHHFPTARSDTPYRSATTVAGSRQTSS